MSFFKGSGFLIKKEKIQLAFFPFNWEKTKDWTSSLPQWSEINPWIILFLISQQFMSEVCFITIIW